MILFPLWFLQLIVFGGLFLCTLGVIGLLTFFIIDSKQNNIW
ncbi:hypothetical protein Pan54_21230 [Rubinisphaera italica]|mgnify:FL=1|uniref:Uncharacterized protein n=1 Tax=Rubinisphaera italica TaxID=2527969 RepID=A0A5C5XEB3_9PLAN|nr:hypothetical protein Pan54_21230 [Rubinisphaera italica]